MNFGSNVSSFGLRNCAPEPLLVLSPRGSVTRRDRGLPLASFLDPQDSDTDSLTRSTVDRFRFGGWARLCFQLMAQMTRSEG